MAYRNLNFMKSISNLAAENEAAGAHDVMLDAGYLRQSSALINEALQKGFDVLQLANGDIVTTGTKTIVHQYTWDESKQKLVKTKASEGYKKAGRRGAKSEMIEADEEEEAEA